MMRTIFFLLILFYAYNGMTQNVGISNPNPTERLHIDSGSVKVGNNLWVATAPKTLMKFGDGDFVTVGEDEADDLMVLRARNFIFRPSPTGLYNGFVGIGGNDYPDYPLTVRAVPGGGLSGLGIIQESPDGLMRVGFYTGSAGAYVMTHSNDNLLFTTNNGLAQMTLTTEGNFGVGINNPNATLSVARKTGIDGTAAFFGTTHVSHFNYGPNEITYLRGGKNNSQVIINDIPGSRVGVGTASPIVSLHVKMSFASSPSTADGIMIENNSNVKWFMSASSADNFEFYKFVTGINGYNIRGYIRGTDGQYIVGSDARLKKEIQPISEREGLRSIMKLNPVKYHMRSDDHPQKYSYGFLSQEVETVFPDFVEEYKGNKMLAYNNFIPVLTKGMQEQQQQIEALKNENAELKVRLDALEKKISGK